MSGARPRLVVVVNGLPGAGKSTLVRALSAELGWPFLSKDLIKESLFDNLGYSDRSWSRRLGAASAELMWTLLATMPGDVLVENLFNPDDIDLTRAGLRRAGAETVVEVICQCPPAEAWHRFWDRIADGSRHPGHAQASEAELEEQDRRAWEKLVREPLTLGLGPVLNVDTTQPVDVAPVAAWILTQRQALL